MFHPLNFPRALMFLPVCISRLRKPTILHKHLRDSLRTTDWWSRWPYVLFASYTIARTHGRQGKHWDRREAQRG